MLKILPSWPSRAGCFVLELLNLKAFGDIFLVWGLVPLDSFFAHFAVCTRERPASYFFFLILHGFSLNLSSWWSHYGEHLTLPLAGLPNLLF